MWRFAALAIGLAIATVAGSAAQAAFPGRNGRIAYSCYAAGTKTQEICAIDADGSNRGYLTASWFERHETTPAWSHDGRMIAYVVSTDARDISRTGGVLRTMTSTGENQRSLAESGETPSWLPDGWIYFGGVGAISPDGRQQRRYGIGAGTVTSVGGQIAGSANLDLYVAERDGAQARDIGRGERPDWSPDGQRLAFEVLDFLGPTGPDFDIWVANPDGSSRRNLTRTPDLQEHAPVFSPDGQWIAYFARARNTEQDFLYVMRSDGTSQQRITSGGSDRFPDWQPCPGACPPSAGVREAVIPAPRVDAAVEPSVLTFGRSVTVRGTVNWPVAEQNVDVSAAICGIGKRAVAIASTNEEGEWRLRQPVGVKTSFWAVFRGARSKLATVRVRPSIEIHKLRGRKYEAVLRAWRSLRGRRLVLQTGGPRHWRAARKITITKHRSAPFAEKSMARFVAPVGRFRVVLPTRQARPCLEASASEIVR